jgi:hypothetical protein
MEYASDTKYIPMIIGGLVFTVLIIVLLLSCKNFTCTSTAPPASLAKSYKESFCNCFGMDDKKCPDLKNVTNSYRDGILTENSNLVRGGWKTVMPDDLFNAKKRPIEHPWNNYVMPYEEWEKKAYNI